MHSTPPVHWIRTVFPPTIVTSMLCNQTVPAWTSHLPDIPNNPLDLPQLLVAYSTHCVAVTTQPVFSPSHTPRSPNLTCTALPYLFLPWLSELPNGQHSPCFTRGPFLRGRTIVHLYTLWKERREERYVVNMPERESKKYICFMGQVMLNSSPKLNPIYSYDKDLLRKTPSK